MCASSQITSWYASRQIEPTWRANHAYVWIVSGFAAQRLLRRHDRVGEAVAVALGREVAVELRDEQPAVREDQDAERAAASTKPAAAIVLPDAVGWRKR